MVHHHFISYSTVQAQEFAYRLHDALVGGAPPIPAWLDKRCLRPGEDWEQRIDEALRDCATVLFVMTPDSVDYQSVCRAEWSRALSFKKIVVPLLLDRSAVAPLRLQDRQRIDFSRDFDSALAQLRSHLVWLETPAGELQRMKDQLLDAERDLRRARDDHERARIEAEMAHLREDIARQQALIDDPVGVKARTEASIEARLAVERRPERVPEATTKFINPPPITAPAYFQDRYDQTRQIADFLRDDALRLLTLVGTGGVGKTATVCRVLKALQAGHLPDDLGPLAVDGIVYLSTGSGPHRLSLPTLFDGLSKLLHAEVAAALDAVYKDPHIGAGDKMRALLEHFPTGRVVVLLDNFEDVVEAETRTIRDGELDEALAALLAAPQHAVKALITTRVKPKDLALLHPERQRIYDLDHGLISPYAENILREMDDDGALGLRDAPDVVLNEARELTRGFPRALEALVAILRSDRDTRLDGLLADLRRWQVRQPVETEGVAHVVQKLVGEAFNRLDGPARQVMQALAIYNRPVPTVAVDYLLQPFAPALDSVRVLGRLVNMHFARHDAGRYYLHPVDCAYSLSLIPLGEDSDRIGLGEPLFTRMALYERGADYFRSARKPREEWKRLVDLEAQLAEIDLRMAAGDYDTAVRVLLDIDFHYLFLWGHYRLMMTLHKSLHTRITDPGLKQRNVGNLGSAYWSMGWMREALDWYEQALALAHEQEDRRGEGVWLGNLGATCQNLGEVLQAVEYHERALAIAREIGDRRSEGRHLSNLGSAYRDLGEVRRAVEYYELAVAIAREIGDRGGAGSRLGNLGAACHNLGEVQRAVEYYEWALDIAREIGDRRNEGTWLGSLSNGYSDLGELQRAVEYYEQAVSIAREIGDRQGEAIRLDNLGRAIVAQGQLDNAIQHHTQAMQIADEIGFLQIQHYARASLAEARLYASDLLTARAAIDEARQYDYPTNNHNVRVVLGVIALRQGERAVAQQAFIEALAAADELLAKTAKNYDALDGKGLALCGLALCEGAQHIPIALEVFRAARDITAAPGIVARLIRRFDALAATDESGLLARVRAVAAGE